MKRFLYFFILSLLISIITFAPMISPVWAESIIASPITQTTIVPETQTEPSSKPTTTSTVTQTSTSNYTTTQYYYESDEYEYYYEDDDEEDYEQPLYSTNTEYQEEYAAAQTASNSTTHSTTTNKTTTSTTTQTTLSNTENNSNSAFSGQSFFNLLGTGVEIAGINTNIIGVIIWCLIAAGLVTVLIILFKNKRNNKRSTIIGKPRYKRSASKSKAKHLLNDKYYSKYK